MYQRLNHSNCDLTLHHGYITKQTLKQPNTQTETPLLWHITDMLCCFLRLGMSWVMVLEIQSLSRKRSFKLGSWRWTKASYYHGFDFDYGLSPQCNNTRTFTLSRVPSFELMQTYVWVIRSKYPIYQLIKEKNVRSFKISFNSYVSMTLHKWISWLHINVFGVYMTADDQMRTRADDSTYHEIHTPQRYPSYNLPRQLVEYYEIC